MAVNAPLDKSSDKSSDSGGLLDLSSRVLSEGEETWLCTWEARMKDMKLIEEEEIPDDLLSISQGSLSDVDDDSLNLPPEATKPTAATTTAEPPPLLLKDIESDTKNTYTSPSHTALGSPSAHVATTELTALSEPTDDARTLMDDFGFNINVAAPHIGSDSPRIVMDEKEEGEAPSDLGPPPPQPTTTTDVPQSLLDDFGFNINVAAPCTDSDSPCLLMDEKEDRGEGDEEAPCDLVPSPPEPAATTEPPQSLLDDFGFNIRLSSPHKRRDSPNKVHRRGNKSNEASPSHELRTKYLMRFDTDLSSTHTKKKLTTVNWSPTKAQILMEFDTNITPSDTDKDSPPSTEKVASVLENALASPRSTEKNSDGQNLLDDFEFKADLSNPPSGERSSEQRSDAQSLLGDFGFEFNASTSTTPAGGNGIDLPIATATGAAVDEPFIAPPSTEPSADTQTLLDDFGFDINVSSAPCTSKTVSADAQITDYNCALPSSSSDPPSRVVPLIAFSSDTVRLWEAKRKEVKSHTTIVRDGNQSPPNSNKADEQTQQTPSEVQSSEEMDPVGGDSVVDRTAATYEKTDIMVDGCHGDSGGVVERRVLARSKQLAKCSPVLTSPVKHSTMEEAQADSNADATFTISDGSSPSNLDQDSGETAVQASSSDGILTVVEKSNSCSAADGEEAHEVDPQSLNSSVSSEYSQASSICSSVSVASGKESSRASTTAAVAAAGRKVVGKIPKPVSKNRPSIKASLLPSKSTTLSKASGACSKLQAPTSRLAKPIAKSIPNPSTRNGLCKPPELKQPTSRLTTTTVGANRSSKLATKTSRESTLRQPTGVPGQLRSKMAAPSAALRKKKVVGGGAATENPSTAVRRQPLTAFAPISSSSESGGVSMAAGSPTADSRAVNSAPSSPPSTSSTTAVNADTEMGTGSTPKTSKRGRRSFIPTPSHDKKPKRTRNGVTGIAVGGAVPSGVFRPRNGPSQINGYRPFKSKVVPPSGSKVVHSPLDKENRPATPHSEWSPVRRKKPLNFEEACIQCTKKIK